MTDADLSEALKREFDGSSLSTQIAGGLHLDRADKDATDPYAVLTIWAQEPQQYTEGVIHKPYIVSIAVYAATGATATKTLSRTLEKIYGKEIVVADGWHIGVWPAAGKFEHDEARRDNRDVVLATKAWRMLFDDAR